MLSNAQRSGSQAEATGRQFTFQRDWFKAQSQDALGRASDCARVAQPKPRLTAHATAVQRPEDGT